MRKIRITEEEKEKIISYLGEGKSGREIGELLGYSESFINGYVRKNDLSKYKVKKFRGIKVNWEDEKEHLKKLFFEDELSQEEIGEIFGVSYRTVGDALKRFGFTRDSIVPKKNKDDVRRKRSDLILKERVCPICERLFTPKEKDQKYCSPKCSSISQRKLPKNDEVILEKLKENNWNYLKTGKEFGISDGAMKKWAINHGVHKSIQEKSKWSDVVDLESAQRKIEELKIRTASELNSNYGGLRYRLQNLDLIGKLKFSGTGFDSLWKNNLYHLIETSLSYKSIQHNAKISSDCRYVNPLTFDIIIEYPDFHITTIEIQGPSHFTQIFSQSSSLDIVQERDRIKYEYCMSHGIDLYYFTYEPKLLEKFGYPHYVYTDENLLLEKLKSYSSPSL